MLAASDQFTITVNGEQTHGSTPWTGVDPIAVAAQVVLGLNLIVSRQTELTKEAAVISVGRVRAGVRNNIIPESAELIGTIRTLDTAMQDKIHADIRRTVEHIALSFGAKVPGPVVAIGNVDMDFCYADYFGTRPSTGYETLGHIDYKYYVDQFSDWLHSEGENAAAAKSQGELHRTLARRHVLESVLDEIKANESKYAAKKTTKTRRKAA